MNEFINKDISEYVESNSQLEPTLLKELNRETHLKILNPRMLSGSYQGRILSMISKIAKPKMVLEIGTYTGYSALCIAEGLDRKGVIDTIDINEELQEIQNKFFKKSGFANQINQHIGNALEVIPKIKKKFDLVFLDADKENYINYFELVIDKINSGGILISDNVLWSGKVIDNNKNDLTTKKLIEFNNLINNDKRIETVIFPVRDGLSISRKI
jgi:predicted O-methyltransferase YrrM|tara:strand:- start:2454 stop:3095 length:642 start_codon:yes stop_codon:yes gene_type:complete